MSTPPTRQHQSYDDYQEVRRENNQNCLQVVHSDTHTHVNSS